jgi:hypothetical protein
MKNLQKTTERATPSFHLESNSERRDGNELERAAIGGCGVAAATVIGSSRSSWRSRRGGRGRPGWWDRNSEVSIGRKGWGDGQKGKQRNSNARRARGTGKEKRSQTVKVAAEKWAYRDVPEGTFRVVVGGGTKRRNGS